MPILSLSSAALKAGAILDSGYYPCKITKVESKASRAGDSTNTWVYFEVVSGKYKGCNLRYLSNEKGLDPAIGAPGAKSLRELIVSLGQSVNDDEGVSIELDGAVNKTLDVYSVPEKNETSGETMNSVKGFRPFSG